MGDAEAVPTRSSPPRPRVKAAVQKQTQNSQPRRRGVTAGVQYPPAQALEAVEEGGPRRSGRTRKENVTSWNARNEHDAAVQKKAPRRKGVAASQPRRTEPFKAPSRRTVATSAPRDPDEVLRWAVRELDHLTGALEEADASAAPPREFRHASDEQSLLDASARMRELVQAGVWNEVCAVCGQYNTEADMAPEGATPRTDSLCCCSLYCSCRLIIRRQPRHSLPIQARSYSLEMAETEVFSLF